MSSKYTDGRCLKLTWPCGSNYGVHHIKEVLDKFPEHPPAINQIEISPFFQRREIVDACREHNIALQAYSPLGKGAFVDREDLHAIGKVGSDVPLL